MKKRDLDNNEISVTIKKRAEKTVEKFRQIAVFGVSDPELLSILKEVLSYWKDPWRPAITSYCCEAVGGKPEIADNAGLIFTLAAAATGIHDEIIDKSLKNHFRRTVLGLYGVEKALLVGDLLLVKAWSTLQELVRNSHQPLRVADVMEAYGLISIQICEAEFAEISYRKRLDIDLADRERTLWNIDADLEACAKAGAILGNGSNEQVIALSGVGRRLGFLLGLKDEVADSLNVEGNLPHRLLFESVPLPIAYAAKSSVDVQTKLQSILLKESIDSLDIANLIGVCIDTSAFSYIYGLAKRNANDASNLLSKVPRNPARLDLELIVENSLRVVEKLCFINSS
jgi:geranylgeranyl pyrophosphate synthase